MSDEHQHPHDHDHDHPSAPVDSAPMEDTGSQALSEALRSSFAIVKVVMVALVVVFLGSGFFKVESQKRAVILHFGKAGVGSNALLGPGLHWSWPYPIDEVRQIPFAEFQMVNSSVGWYNTTPEKEALDREDPPGASLKPGVDGYTITGDGNIIHTRATLRFRITDPIRYVFSFVDASNAVQSALDNSLLYASCRFKVDDVLTKEITKFQDVVRQHVTELVQQENLGISIEQCNVQSKPPRQLKQAFDNVLVALSKRDQTHNEAVGYQNKTLSQAEAEAAARTNSAAAESAGLVGAVRAEAKRFESLLPSFNSNQALFVSVTLNETIARVMTNVQDKIYLQERADGKPRELRLQLSREPVAPPQQKPPGTP